MKIIDFWAPWCQPCKQMYTTIERLEAKYTVQKVNIDEDKATAMKYGVMSIPTTIILDEDKEIKRFTGVTSYETIEKAMDL